MALTKAEMADKLFDQLGLNKREAKDLVEGFFECLRNSLENAQQVFRVLEPQSAELSWVLVNLFHKSITAQVEAAGRPEQNIEKLQFCLVFNGCSLTLTKILLV